MRTSGLVLVVTLSVLSVAPVWAQMVHTAPQSALDAALTRHLEAAQTDRADVQQVLDHPAVKAIAQDMGVDLRDARSAMATLDAGETSRIAAQARQVERALAGGQSSITISTTMIIIGLLILILIIVAV